MKPLALVVLTIGLLAAVAAPARSETAIGASFGYPGNVGLSLRFDNMPINAAWSSDFLHGPVDLWLKKTPLENAQWAWYYGAGADIGLPLDDNEDFFLAARVPIGLQWMVEPKIELFGEVAPGLQILDDVDFYIASNIGIRFVLGK